MQRRAQQIFDFIAVNPNCTERQVVDGVGLKKTPYSRHILVWLWTEGYVVRWLDTDSWPNVYRYFVQLTQRAEGF